MLLDTYKDEELMWLTTCFGPVSDTEQGFRGDLVIIHGEKKQATGSRNLPPAQIRQAVILGTEDTLTFIAGNMASVDELPPFIEKYGPALADDVTAIFLIDNLADNATLDYEGKILHLRRCDGGTSWNELLDLAFLDKSDFKGQKAEEKVKTLADTLKSYDSKAPLDTLENILASKTDAKREAWGAI